MKINTIGIDLAKSVFHIHGVDEGGKTVLKKKLMRDQVLTVMSNTPSCLVGLEACGGSHYWARELAKLGHDVRLMAAQFVKPYVKSNKNDMADAEAICEAVARPNMRFVPIKSEEQQQIIMLHRIRSRMVRARTALVNEIRGFLHEFGIVTVKGRKAFRSRIYDLLDQNRKKIPPIAALELEAMIEEYDRLEERIQGKEKQLKEITKQCDRCQRLLEIPGIGTITATAMVASIGNASAFTNARQLSAWLGLVPKQHSTGGKQVLLGISKRGDRYMRTLLIHGARAVLRALQNKKEQSTPSAHQAWAVALKERQGTNKAAVAMANKTARIIWAMLRHDRRYDPKYQEHHHAEHSYVNT